MRSFKELESCLTELANSDWKISLLCIVKLLCFFLDYCPPNLLSPNLNELNKLSF